MHVRTDLDAPELPIDRQLAYMPERTAGAIARREITGAVDPSNVDDVIADHVRRARAEAVPEQRMVAALERLLADRYRTRSSDEDRAAAIRALVRRAVVRYGRDD